MNNYNSYTINALTSSGYILKGYDNATISISADSIEDSSLRAKISQVFNEDELKKKITKILLEDPDCEVKKIAEDYLIQCIYEATNDPENNPILQKFFGKNQEEIAQLRDEVWQMRNEFIQVKGELQELKGKLGIGMNDYNAGYNGVAWKNDTMDQFTYLENKLINIAEKLGKAGININYWEN